MGDFDISIFFLVPFGDYDDAYDEISAELNNLSWILRSKWAEIYAHLKLKVSSWPTHSVFTVKFILGNDPVRELNIYMLSMGKLKDHTSAYPQKLFYFGIIQTMIPN